MTELENEQSLTFTKTNNFNEPTISPILKMKIKRMINLWKKSVKKSKHRKNILQEWSTTEKAYLKDLHTIVSKIQEPLHQYSLITEEEDRILFPNMQAMLQLSVEVLKLIDGFLVHWNPITTVIADPLINLHNYFIIYREYCNNFAKAQKIIKNVTANPKCNKIVSELPMDIESFIIKPVQRPPKYQLLLREYQKALPPSHIDYNKLSIAISKYHEVNEENNQSMDLQIRNEIMIGLDNKYGGIINTTRVYLFEEFAKCIEFRMKIYVFNDMILVVKILNEDREEGYKKIFLDGLSFVEAPMDGKYLINKLFICGIKDNLHLNFVTASLRDKTFDKIQTIIHDLYRKQLDRNNIKKKVKLKLNSLKIKELQIQNRPKLRVTVVGVEKRPISLINISFETVYILKIQSPFPNINFQHSYVKFETLCSLSSELRSKNKMLEIPVVDDWPEDMSMYDVKKNKTRIIECRHIYIERFINFVLRCEELGEYIGQIVKALKINEDLWKFVGFAEPCTCEICQQSESISSLKEYEEQKSLIKTFGYQNYPQKEESESGYSVSEFSCIYNIFTLPKTILENSAEELNTLQRRFLWMECKMGRIDYSLFPKSDQENTLKLSINFQSLRENEAINIKISKQTTVLEVLDEIAEMYQISTMRDFGLFLDYQKTPRYLDRDEILYEALIDIGFEFNENTENKEGSSMWKKWKKWGEEMIVGKKSTLYIKKYLFVTDKLEILACQENPERYPLLVEEIFYRFKNELMIFDENDTKSICALYYVCNFMDKLAHLNLANFQMEKLKNVIPESKWNQLQKSEKEIFTLIKNYESIMEKGSLPQTRRASSSSNMFSLIEVLYDTIIKIAHKSVGWTTMFFDVVNYDPPTLKGSRINLLLGINPNNLFIIENKELEPLLKIELKNLKYKITVFSIFIETEERILRFDGTMMYGVKNLIETYKLMAEKFND